MLESQIIDRTASPLGLFLTLMVAACGSDAETGADWVGTANGKLAPGAGITACVPSAELGDKRALS
jgi:hypothetical protein